MYKVIRKQRFTSISAAFLVLAETARRLNPRGRHGIALALILGFASVQPGMAQTVYNFIPAVPVAGPAQTQILAITIVAGGTLNTIHILTEGSANLDYQDAGGGSCTLGVTYSAGQQCTVKVSFQARFPGARHGAIVLTQSAGPAIGAIFLEGSGSGGLSVLSPGYLDTVAGDAGWYYNYDNVLATTSDIYLPQGEVTDAAGNLYIADTSNNRVRRVDAGTQFITTVAGGSSPGYSGDNGPATAALLSSPTALAMDGAGRLFISDSANAVVRVLDTITGIITIVAGGGHGASGDGGPALSATLSGVEGLAIDAQHHLFIADTGNNVIHEVDLATGIITRFAGTGSSNYTGDNGPALNATFRSPQGINFGPDGSLYVADFNNNRIRRIDPSGTITTVAGNGGFNAASGPATGASLNLPTGVAVDQAGNLYIADSGWNLIRKVTASTGLISTIAGDQNEQFLGDGANADHSEFYNPSSLFYDGQGNLFISDTFHNRVRRISGNLATYKYDPIRVGRTSPSNPETVENDGTDDLVLTQPTLVNASLDPASTTCGPTQTLAKGMSCVLGIAFSPTVLGLPARGSVTLSTASGNSPGIVTLSGNALLVDPTAITVTSSQNPSGLGTSVTFIAHATTQGTTFTGTVQFFNGASSLGVVPLAALGAVGTAAVTTPALTLGRNNITAVYSGDATNETSTSPVLVQSVKQSSTTVLLSSLSLAPEATPVTLTATVLVAGVPTGSVVFADGGITLSTVPLTGSPTAQLTISTFTIGSHKLTAAYSGDTNNGPSVSNVYLQIVQGQGSIVSLNLPDPIIPVGSSATFLAQVSSNSSSAVPSGNMTFKDGSAVVGSAILNGAGAATFSTTSLSPGLHAITAVYGGDAIYAANTSAMQIETVQQIATIAAVSSSANPVAAGAAVTLTAAVFASINNPTGGANPTGGVITGTVTFLDGGVQLGTGALSAHGLATLTAAGLPLGGNAIIAVYGGSTNYLASSSAAIGVTVRQATSTTTLGSSKDPSIVEDPLTLIATVATNGGKATGIVTFSNGGTPLGQAALDANGVAALATSSLLAGQHGLVASYAGDVDDLPSVSAPLNQTILLRPSAETLTSSATSLNGGQQVTLISVTEWTGPIVPRGIVTFKSGAIVLGAGTLDSTGVATLTINPQPGLTSITSTYAGDSIFLPSTSKAIAVSVGQPPQFTLSASSTALTMLSLQHGTVTLTAASEKGFSDKLALGCSGLPKAATCTFSQDWMMLAANGKSTVTIVVDTGSPLTAGSVAENETPHRSELIALCGLPGGALLWLLFAKSRRLRSFGGLLLLLCSLGMMAGLSGCGSMSINGTPAGVYNFQITASATGTGVIQGVNMTLTVGK